MLGTLAVKIIATFALALSALAAVSTAQAQERPVTLDSGSVAVEPPPSLLRGTSPVVTASVDAPVVRKVRVVLQSPYGN